MKSELLLRLVAGLILTVALIFPGAVGAAEGGSAGRYQIVVDTNSARQTFLIDTATGHIWLLNTITALESEPEVWEPMPRFDSARQETDWLKTQTPKPKE